MKSQMIQKCAGLGLFLIAILCGMHVAGQTATKPDAGSPTNTTSPSSGSPNSALNNSSPSAPTVSPVVAPNPAAQNPESMPAFGASGQKGALDVLRNSEVEPRKPTPTPSPKFVPSEVEVFAPKKVKVTNPKAILHTSVGDITFQLYFNYAPKTVRHFIDLVRGDRDFTDVKTGRTTRRPFYTNLFFHRVLPGHLIQAGCPFGNGRGGPGFTVPDEISDFVHFDKPGILAMAPQRKDNASVKDSNGSQFFITLNSFPDWDGKFTIIGEVERGMKVVNKIGTSKTGPTDRPIRRIYIYGIDIIDENTSAAPKVETPTSLAPSVPSNQQPAAVLPLSAPAPSSPPPSPASSPAAPTLPNQ